MLGEKAEGASFLRMNSINNAFDSPSPKGTLAPYHDPTADAEVEEEDDDYGRLAEWIER